MEPSTSRLQLRLIAASYAVVVAVSALLVFQRILLYRHNPQEAEAAGGMYAGGDLALELIILLLLLVPTAAFGFVIRKSEAAYTTYAKVLLALSFTAPAAVIFAFVPFLNQWYWGDLCIFRLFAIPVMLTVFALSRWLARFSRARRLISYALLVEGLTLVGIIVAGVFLFSKGGHG